MEYNVYISIDHEIVCQRSAKYEAHKTSANIINEEAAVITLANWKERLPAFDSEPEENMHSRIKNQVYNKTSMYITCLFHSIIV